MPSNSEEIRELIARIRTFLPEDNQRLHNYFTLLEERLNAEQGERETIESQLTEYATAYEKLTSPANRVGVLLEQIEGDVVLVALGDSDFVVNVDPAVPEKELLVGFRVFLNDAYAVVGVCPPHTGGFTAKILAVEDDRLQVGRDGEHDAQARYVLQTEDVKKAAKQVGDQVRIEPMGRVAVEVVEAKTKRDYFFEDVPQLSWSDIGGQELALEAIRDSIELPLLHPEIFAKFDKMPPKGILLYGPPGCGKTLIGKAIASNLARRYSEVKGKEMHEYFMHIEGPKVLNMWLGESERIVREIFSIARTRASENNLVVIFIDEAESILRTRSSGRFTNISNTVVPQFCAEMDGMVGLENVVIILTSNRPDYIDPAILRPERIDRKIKVVRPDKAATREILSIYLKESLPFDANLLKQFDNEPKCVQKALVERTTEYLWREVKSTEFLTLSLRNGSNEMLHWKDFVSGALLKSVVDRAKEYAIKRAILEPKSTEGIKLEDLEHAVEAEFAENEIFPKTDQMEDWLRLIDVEPENVINVRPVRQKSAPSFLEKQII